MIRNNDWMERALCAEIGGSLFFPEDGASARPAKFICGSCPVRAACLQRALDDAETEGIWGGLSVRERRKIRLAA